jgi:hypothetical protein
MSEGEPADELTGLPVVRTWRGVYLLVVLAFIVWVGVMLILERMYS